jgi:hypothetical protein
MRTTLFHVLITLVFTACSIKNAQRLTTGIFPLTGYTSKVIVPADTLYSVYTNESGFNAAFTAAANSRKPAFNGQTVYSIVLPKENPQNSLQWQKAEVWGSTMNIYLAGCTTVTGADCLAGPYLLATTARILAVKKVQFYINGFLRKTVSL